MSQDPPATPEPPLLQPRLSQIFGAFLRLGLTAFGGPAMVPFIGELAVGRQWLTRPVFKEGVAIAQTIPGATAMQLAAYVGLRSRGLAGGAAAYLGFGLPAFVLMAVLSAVYGFTHASPISASLFRGLQAIVVAIVARAFFTFGRTTLKTWPDAAIALAAAAYLARGGHPMLAIALGVVAGLLLYRLPGAKAEAEAAPAAPAPSYSLRPLLLVALAALLALLALRLTAPRLYELATLMLRIDLFAFGGGFASVPLMLHEVVAVRQWVTTGAFMDGIAMGQVTPGPIVITATFIGYQLAGFGGALCATISIFLPSFLIVAAVVPHFDRLRSSAWFQRGIRGVLASFVGLLLAVTLQFALAAPWTAVSGLLALMAFTALMLKVDVPWVVLPGAVLSLLLLR